MKTISKLFALSILLVNISCSTDLCGDYYSSVKTTIKGEPLTEYYTIRVSTGEKIHYAQKSETDVYSVLEEDYNDKLNGALEDFIFVGIINNKEVFREEYSIKGSDCHIFRQTGATHIEY